jgi:hypothetical protein
MAIVVDVVEELVVVASLALEPHAAMENTSALAKAARTTQTLNPPIPAPTL